MKAKNNKETKSNENPGITSSPSSISYKETMPNNRKEGLAATLNNEEDNEEWLIEKHRILDSRMEYRNQMVTINKANAHRPTI